MPTSFYTEIKDDYLEFDNVVTVSVTNDEGTIDAAVSAMFDMLPIQRTIGGGSGGEFQSNTPATIIFLFDSTLGGMVPAVGMEITLAAGDIWTITDPPRHMAARAQWRCLCVSDRS